MHHFIKRWQFLQQELFSSEIKLGAFQLTTWWKPENEIAANIFYRSFIVTYLCLFDEKYNVASKFLKHVTRQRCNCQGMSLKRGLNGLQDLQRFACSNNTGSEIS